MGGGGTGHIPYLCNPQEGVNFHIKMAAVLVVRSRNGTRASGLLLQGSPSPGRETRWSRGYWTRLRIERSGFETLCGVLGQILHSHSTSLHPDV